MIEKLHQEELQRFTEPSIHKNACDVVEYQKAYYSGRDLESPDGFFVNFKFLRSAVFSGAKMIDWPRCDDTDRVHIIIKLARSSSVLKPKGS